MNGNVNMIRRKTYQSLVKIQKPEAIAVIAQSFTSSNGNKV